MKYPLEYCALRYLLLWETLERKLHAAMTDSPSPAALRESMQHFRIARSFKGVAEEPNATLILTALDRVGRNASASPCDNVVALATEFQKDFGKFNVSAASRLLWLTFRSPYIIYDARAIAALRSLGCEFENKDYPKFYAAWHSQYDQHRLEIRCAAQRLTTLQPFFSTWHDSEGSLAAVTSQLWFRERVFDNYLWEMGDGQQIGAKPAGFSTTTCV